MSYIPHDTTLDHFIWRKTYFREDNVTPLFHYKMLDHYFTSSSYIKPVKAFRGSAKSTNTCYVALHRAEMEHSHYTLIISDTAAQAESLVADISDMLRESALPYEVVRDVSGEIELRYKGKRYFIVAKGAGASMRGIKRGRKRPDLIILDDIVNDQLVMNRLRIARLNRWFYKALLPSLDPNGEIYAVGTPLNNGDLFMHLCGLHETIEIPLTPSAWPDRFPEEWIRRKKDEYERAGMLRAYKQEFDLVLSDSETQLFDMSKVRYITEDEIPDDLTWYLAADLAISQNSSADYSAFVCVGISTSGMWYVYPTQGRLRPSESAAEIFRLVNKFEILNIGVEQGATYLAMSEHLDALMSDYQTFFYVEELKHGGVNKHARVKSLEPVVNSGKLIIIDNGKDAEELVEQLEMTDNEAINSTHDDLIDALSYHTQMVPRYMEELPDIPVENNYTR